MNIEDYIESGILERYVLGDVTDQERQEVQCMKSIYSELEKELHSIEQALLDFGKSAAINPPASVKEQLMAGLETKTISISKKDSQIDKGSGSNSILFKSAAALAVLLFIGTLAVYMSSSSEKQALANELASMASDREATIQRLADFAKRLRRNEELIAFFQDPATKTILMKGLPEKAPEALASVFWNSSKNNAYLKVSNMPALPEGKQYQLWAIVDGKPADMGVFELAESSSSMQKLPDVSNAQAFAVTIEPAGGSLNPTLEEMIVIGEV